MTRYATFTKTLVLIACAVLAVAANPAVSGGSMSIAAPASCVPDKYEPDDAPWQAKYLITGQLHTFHTESDVDWVQFDADAGMLYKIGVGNADQWSFLTAALELYDRDGATLLASGDWSGSTSYSKRISYLDWMAPASGTYFIKMTSHSMGLFECDAGYSAEIYMQDVEPGTGRIMGIVWEDSDWSGSQQSDELPLEGIVVSLEGHTWENPDTPLVLTAVTDLRGFFVFDVPTGSYVLTRVDPPGYIPTGTDYRPGRRIKVGIYSSGYRRAYLFGLYSLFKELPACHCYHLPLLQR